MKKGSVGIIVGIVLVILVIGVAVFFYFKFSSSQSTEANRVGVIGCSLTLGADSGYYSLGGNLLWQDKEISSYPGGSAYKWYTGIASKDARWQIFESLIVKYPNTTKIWWMLCPGTETNTYEQEITVLNKIKSIAPGREIYISAAPKREGYICNLESTGSQDALIEIASKLVSEGKVKRGPALTGLTQAQTGDGCHPNSEGQAIWGKNLIDFFGNGDGNNTVSNNISQNKPPIPDARPPLNNGTIPRPPLNNQTTEQGQALAQLCGDGVCDDLEKTKGICPADCG